MDSRPPWELSDHGAGQPPQAVGGWGSPPSTAASPALRPLDLGDVLDGMFRLLVRHWRTFVVALGVVLVPVNLITVYVQRQANANLGLFAFFRDPNAAAAAFGAGPTAGLSLWAVGAGFILGLLATPFITGVSAAIAAQGYLGDQPQPGTVLRRAGKRFWTLVGAALLAWYLLALLPFVPGFALIVSAGSGTVSPLLLVAFPVLLLGAALWLVVRFVFVFFPLAIVLEGAGPIASLRRSVRLVRSRFWPLAGTLLLAVIVAVIIGFVIALPLTVPGLLVSGTGGYVLTAVGTIVATILTTPLFTNAVTLAYFDTRIRTEGFDLDVLARSVEAPAAGGAGAGFGSLGGPAG